MGDLRNYIFLEKTFINQCRNSEQELLGDLDRDIPISARSDGSDVEIDFDEEEVGGAGVASQPILHSLEEAIRAEDIDYENKQVSEDSYVKLPPYYTNAETWPRTTALKCWHCHLMFGTAPIPLPIAVERNVVETADELEEVMQFKSYGNFCSFNCISAYIENVADLRLQNHLPTRRAELLRILLLFYRHHTGYSVDYIPPSPPPHTMIQYGGDRTEENYRAAIRELSELYQRSVYDSSIERVRVKVKKSSI